MVYDIILLVLFIAFVVQFLIRNKKNLKKDGLLFLYRTKWGMNLIKKTGKKYKKTLKFLSHVSIGIGYLLMGVMLWLFGKIVYLYVAYPAVVRSIKVPPIMPLIPYLPQAFKLNFLPPFYFIYWIAILAIIAITHEFAHGIFMSRYNIKIKSTGFGFFPFFLPVFLAAFVEQDEKSMERANNFKQRAVLSAGTFANIITALLGFLVMILFFISAYSPAGVAFDGYAYGIVGLTSISSVNGISFENQTYQNLVSLMDEDGYNEVETSKRTYLATKDFLDSQENVEDRVLLYLDSPALRSNLTGVIAEINGVQIKSLDGLSEEIYKYSPNEQITLGINDGTDIYNVDLVLGEYPENPEIPWMGISFENQQKSGLLGRVMQTITSYKKPHVYYEARFEAADFIYNFLWWLVLISFSVALVNMLPMGIFDGGKFFYLTILRLTNNKNKAEKWFKGVTKFLLFLVFVLMAFWAWSFIA